MACREERVRGSAWGVRGSDAFGVCLECVGEEGVRGEKWRGKRERHSEGKSKKKEPRRHYLHRD